MAALNVGGDDEIVGIDALFERGVGMFGRITIVVVYWFCGPVDQVDADQLAGVEAVAPIKQVDAGKILEPEDRVVIRRYQRLLGLGARAF